MPAWAADYFHFKNDSGNLVKAQVRQAVGGELWQQPDWPVRQETIFTWQQRFDIARNKLKNASIYGLSDSSQETNPVPYRIAVYPARPLPIGTGWTLEVLPGIALCRAWFGAPFQDKPSKLAMSPPLKC